MQLNVLDDLAEAMKALDGKKILLAKQHGLRSNRRYFMPSTLAEAMAQLLENTSNEGLHLAKSILTRERMS